jgi:hypothetical protein
MSNLNIFDDIIDYLEVICNTKTYSSILKRYAVKLTRGKEPMEKMKEVRTGFEGKATTYPFSEET